MQQKVAQQLEKELQKLDDYVTDSEEAIMFVASSPAVVWCAYQWCMVMSFDCGSLGLVCCWY